MIPLILALLGEARAEEVDPADFADHLRETGDPFNALTWYRLALFADPDRPDADALRFRIALTYELGDRYEAAEAAWLSLADDRPSLAGPALYRAAAVQLEAGRPAVARMHLADLRLTEPGATERADLVEAASWLHEGRPTEGAAHLRTFTVRHPSSRWAGAASEAAAVAERPIPRRSPALAGAMSLVLPGSGQVYAGNPGDGFMALLASGVLGAWSATLLVYGVEEERSWAVVGGGLLGGVAAFTWSGNVLGAVRGAKRTNRFLLSRQAERALVHLADPTLELVAEEVVPPAR